MSMKALLKATKSEILTKLTFNDREINENICDITPDSRPASGNAGELFISVHAGSIRNTSFEVLDCLLGINITLNFRFGRIPQDRVGTELIVKDNLGIEDLVDDIIDLIHSNQYLINLANTLIPNSKNKFVEPLRFNVSSAPRIVGGEWFHSSEKERSGMTQTLSFENARRVKFTDFMSFAPEIGNGIVPFYGNNNPEGVGFNENI